MALFHVFLFWFSVRLGSIIIGIMTAIQGAIWLVHMVQMFNDKSYFSQHLEVVLDDFGFHGAFFEDLINDPSTLMKNFIAYFAGLIISSIFLIWGSIQIQLKLMYPFIAFYVFYIAVLALQLSVFIMSLKSNESGLGDMILYSNLGSFALLFYLYTLGIVVSFIQIVKDLRKRLEKKPLLVKEAQKKIDAIYDSYNMKEAYFEYLKSFTK